MSNEVNIAKEITTKIPGPAAGENTPQLKAVFRDTPVSEKQSKEEGSSQATLIEENIKKAVEDINQHLQDFRREIQFSVDKETGKTVIKVYEQETSKLIRQIPPEEALEIARHLIDSDGKGKLLKVSA